MKMPIDKARHFLAAAAGQNDNAANRAAQIVFNGPVTIVVDARPFVAVNPVTRRDPPPYLIRHKALMDKVPPLNGGYYNSKC
ncbi:MAG: hypothetical protein HQL35_04740 [Alphaproteobacteria bacterium]|nr:hypothetical protein [Alphaproteobacteria bacterium]